MTQYLGPSLSSQLAFPTSEGTTRSPKYEEGEGHMPPRALTDGGLAFAIRDELPPRGHDTLEWQ
jgi:hypothetical protein